MVLGTLYFAACLGLMLWSGAAELGSLDFTSFRCTGRRRRGRGDLASARVRAGG
jgi:hypothetical protein